ncbi:hypothetical protein F8388_020298 [Cannabis sativa]|uniref:Uncharacterized protein n=1 Tax=Cannabis sativa TaxID=3483 RepID=A0A7J6FVW1_CANSA|nr:hypothetical protein F8388_020298 [Cannabis sativa]
MLKSLKRCSRSHVKRRIMTSLSNWDLRRISAKKQHEKEEKAKKSLTINEFLKPAEGERFYSGGRGRGRAVVQEVDMVVDTLLATWQPIH